MKAFGFYFAEIRKSFAMKFEHAAFEFHGKLSSGLFVKRLNLALELDRQWKAFAVNLLADRHLDPAFADAVFFNIHALFVVEKDAYVVLKNGFDMVLAAHVG